MKQKRIYLSPPWVDKAERQAIAAAFDSGYVAPCGPLVDEFERALAKQAGRKYAVAVASGTAALDLIMADLGVDSSWTVFAPTLTFIATVGPAWHRGARLVFIDSDETGNMDVSLLDQALSEESATGRAEKVPGAGEPTARGAWCLVPGAGAYGAVPSSQSLVPSAEEPRTKHYELSTAAKPLSTKHQAPSTKHLVLSVDLYGRCCDYAAIAKICRKHHAVFVSDSAEAVGATCAGRPAGSAGVASVYSFNGNKIITTSGGGAVLTDSKRMADHVRKLAQQSREAHVWYEHKEVGYNYRLSNLLAGVGLAQLRKLPAILNARRRNRKFYLEQGLTCLPMGEGNHWLTVALLPSTTARDRLLKRFAAADIEVRPVWKPMHLQSVFAGCRVYGGEVAAELFARGICLPSGTGLTAADFARIAAVLA